MAEHQANPRAYSLSVGFWEYSAMTPKWLFLTIAMKKVNPVPALPPLAYVIVQ